HRFLAYTFPSRSPRPAHPAVLNRRDFVEAAPALPTDPWLRLPPASPHCYDSEEMDGLSPPSATAAPRGALVLHPAPYHRIDPPGEAAHGVPGAQVQPPAAHLGTHLGQGILADRGQERGELHPVLAAGRAGAEGEPQERERRVLVRAAPVAVLAVHDPGLGR